MWSWNKEDSLLLRELLVQYNKPKDSSFLGVPSSSLAGTLIQRLEQAGDILTGREQADLKQQEMSVTMAVCNTIPLAEHSWSSLHINFMDTLTKAFPRTTDNVNWKITGHYRIPERLFKSMGSS